MAEHNLVKYTEHISFTANNPTDPKQHDKSDKSPDKETPITKPDGSLPYKSVYTMDELVGTFG
jgi:hypothetical protein